MTAGGADGDVHDQLAALCRAAPASTGTDVATLTLSTRTRQRARVYFSDDIGGELDEEQTTLGEGPSIDASRDGHPVFAADLAGATARRRWPFFAARATDKDMHSAFAFPLRIGAINLGVLALFRHVSGHLHEVEVSRALRLAGTAAYTMLDLYIVRGSAEGAAADGVTTNGVTPHTTRDSVVSVRLDDGETGLYRPEVHQASGMVMVQLNIPIEEALARLRAYAFAEGVPLPDIARAVVARTLRLDDDETEDGRR